MCCTGRKAHKCSPWRLPGGVWLRLRATSLYSTNGWQQEAAVTHMQCSTELGARKRPSRATKSGCFQWSSSAIAVSAPRQRPRQAQAKGPLGCRRVRCGVTLQVQPHQRDVRDALRAIPARDAAPAAHIGPAPCAQVIRSRGLVQVRQAAAPLLQDGCVVARVVDGHPERAGLLGRSCWRSRRGRGWGRGLRSWRGHLRREYLRRAGQCPQQNARQRPADVASHQARATLARPEPAVKPACGAALQRCLALGMACVLWSLRGACHLVSLQIIGTTDCKITLDARATSPCLCKPSFTLSQAQNHIFLHAFSLDNYNPPYALSLSPLGPFAASHASHPLLTRHTLDAGAQSAMDRAQTHD